MFERARFGNAVLGMRVAMTSRFVRFLSTSGVAAFVNLLARYVLNHAMRYEVAVALAFPFGVLTAYVLAKAFVFEASSLPVRSQLARFTAINLLALVVVWTVSVVLARITFPWMGLSWHANDLAHLIGVASPAVFAYVAHQRYSFLR
jgi:putative flippase GtrA